MKWLSKKLIAAALLSSMLALLLSVSTQSQTTSFQKSCADLVQSKGQASDSVRLHQLFDLCWKHGMEENPEFATYIGYPGLNDKLTDQSAAAIERRKKESPLIMEAVNSIVREKLSEADRLNYALFKDQTALQIEGAEFPQELTPISQLGGVQQDIPQLVAVMPTNTVKDYQNILARLAAVPTVVSQVRALLERGAKQGITPPQITLRDVPQQVRDQIVKDPAEAPVLVSFKTFPNSMPAEIGRASCRERV